VRSVWIAKRQVQTIADARQAAGHAAFEQAAEPATALASIALNCQISGPPKIRLRHNLLLALYFQVLLYLYVLCTYMLL
jgi:hypothetical protein